MMKNNWIIKVKGFLTSLEFIIAIAKDRPVVSRATLQLIKSALSSIAAEKNKNIWKLKSKVICHFIYEHKNLFERREI